MLLLSLGLQVAGSVPLSVHPIARAKGKQGGVERKRVEGAPEDRRKQAEDLAAR